MTGNATDSYAATEPFSTIDMHQYAKNTLGWIQKQNEDTKGVLDEDKAPADLEKLSLSPSKLLSSREKHEIMYWAALQDTPDAETVYNKLSKTFRSRAVQGYLFDCEKNQEIMAGDPWLEDVWVWIEGLSPCSQ